MKLISMVEFVIKSEEIEEKLIKNAEKLDRYELVVDAQFSFADKVKAYAKFLSQPLSLGMFIPCDENNNIVKEPDLFNYHINKKEISAYEFKLKKYQEAKDRVLFNRFNLISNTNLVTIQMNEGRYLNWDKEHNYFAFCSGFNIERLIQNMDLFLTDSAKKQIGL